MTTTLETAGESTSEANTNQQESLQLVTFQVGKVLLGIDIQYVQEINRLMEVTPVPETSDKIHGVVNLRGEVVSVLNAHQILSLPKPEGKTDGRNLILNLDGERLGVLVDGVSDIMSIRRSDLSPRPSNVPSIDRRFISSVYLQEHDLIIVVDPDGLIAAIND